MSIVAVIRPDSWDLPLFVHVLGAMVMVGALVLAASYLFIARRDGSLESVKAGFRSLLFAALPAFIVMRGGAEWIADKEGLKNSDVTWIGIGYGTSDLGALLIIVTTIVSWLALRRARREGSGAGRSATVAASLVAVLIALYVVAIWAMATKPT
jgi:heme A synthase